MQTVKLYNSKKVGKLMTGWGGCQPLNEDIALYRELIHVQDFSNWSHHPQKYLYLLAFNRFFSISLILTTLFIDYTANQKHRCKPFLFIGSWKYKKCINSAGITLQRDTNYISFILFNFFHIKMCCKWILQPLMRPVFYITSFVYD